MGFFDYLYIFVAFMFALMTFLIILRNFQSKFTEDGQRKDLIEKELKEKSLQNKED